MSEHTKKLKYIKTPPTVVECKLYNSTSDVGSNYLAINDGSSNPVYAKLDSNLSHADASDLRVRKGSTTYAVLKQASSVPTLYGSPSAYYDPGNASSYPGSGTSVYDLSGNSKTGTMSNVTYSSDSGGKFTFNGTTSGITLGSNSDFNFTEFTIGAWMRCTGRSGNYNNYLFYKGTNTTEMMSIYLLDGGAFGNGTPQHEYWYRSYGYDWYARGGDELEDSTWHYVVGVRASTYLALYVDGSLVQQNNYSPVTPLSITSYPLTVGKRGAYSQALTGDIGPFHIYNSALNATQISQNFDVYKSRYGF